jgi:L-Ala-D/L-Glu epimerase
MAELLISKIEIFKLDLPLKQPFVIALGTVSAANNIIVRIHAQGGLYGVGEASPFVMVVGETQASGFALAQDIARLWKGKNALEIEPRLAEMDRFVAGAPTTRSAFDMALHDLLGKHTGLPLYALLGGQASRPITTDMTVGIGPADRMAAEALAFQQAGFPAVKVKLGTQPAADLARVRAIREAVGPELPLRLDANQGWDVPAALQVLRALAHQGIQYCEQPVPHWDLPGLAHVRAHSPVPIMADEALFTHRDAYQLARAGACDYFNIKLSKSGGIAHALKITAVGEAAGLASQIGCMSETRLGLTAFAHLVLARQNIRFADLDSALMHAEDPVVGGLTYGPGGTVQVPEAPGLGADLAEAWLAKAERAVV